MAFTAPAVLLASNGKAAVCSAVNAIDISPWKSELGEPKTSVPDVFANEAIKVLLVLNKSTLISLATPMFN